MTTTSTASLSGAVKCPPSVRTKESIDSIFGASDFEGKGTDLPASSQWLRIGHLRFEKCEIREAETAFELALRFAKEEKNPKAVSEALVGLLRFSGESLDQKKSDQWEAEIDQLIRKCPDEMPASVWYSKGALATYRYEWKSAQKYFHRFLRETRKATPHSFEPAERSEARAWAMLANVFQQRGHLRRALWLIEEAIARFEKKKLRGINGILFLIWGTIAERQGQLGLALKRFQMAHAAFLEEHNWYHHLYVLFGYARIARKQQKYSEALWHLDLINKAASSSEFGILRREVAREKKLIESESVDLVIDSRNGMITTREKGQIQLRKQYTLLEILRSLSEVHRRDGDDAERSLSKSQIIERVWGEVYRPEAHDNKLYYNINRLRKLIEADAKRPKYLVNWKEGYRLAPGLRVRFVESHEDGVHEPKRGHTH